MNHYPKAPRAFLVFQRAMCVLLMGFGLALTARAQSTAPTPSPPVDDFATVLSGSSVEIGHLDNDAMSPTFYWGIVSGPVNGVATVISGGGRSLDRLSYRANPGFVGTEKLTYEVCKGVYTAGRPSTCNTGSAVGFQTAIISITVLAPIRAVNDAVSIEAGETILVRVQDNDQFAPATNPSLRVVRAPANGTATVITSGTTAIFVAGIQYTPRAGFSGIDTLDYEICRLTAASTLPECATATLTITVAGPPVANNDSAVTLVGQSIVVDVLANDTNVTPVASVTVRTPPRLGTAVYTSAGLQYVGGSVAGIDTLEYEVCRRTPGGPLCGVASVTIELAPAPIAVDDSVLATINRTAVFDVTSNDAGVNPRLIAVIEPPTHGRALADAAGLIAYTPNADYSGPDRFVYRVCSRIVPTVCVSATVSIDVGRPVSDVAISKTVSETPRLGQSINFTITVTNNGPEPTIGELTFVDVVPSSLSLTSIVFADTPWKCSLTPTRLLCTSTSPMAVGETSRVVVSADVGANATPDAQGLCGDRNEVSVVLADGPTNSRDNNSANNSATLSFAIIPAPPVALADAAPTIINRAVSLNPVRNDRVNLCGGKLDDRSVEFVPGSQVGAGTFARAADGSIAFQPAPGFRGIASIRYTIVDGRGQRSNEATITVNVLPPNFYVSNFNDASVNIIDIETLNNGGSSGVTAVSVPQGPDGITVSAGGESVYVASYLGNSVTRIDGATKQVWQQITVPGGPLAMAALSSGSLLVAQYDAGSLIELPVAATSAASARTLTVGRQPAGLVVAADGKAYVAIRGENKVVRVDTATMQVESSIGVGLMPGGIALNAARNELYVANGASNSLSVIDLAKQEVAATIALNALSPGAIAVSRDGRTAYISMFHSNSVAVVDLGTRTVSGSIAVGRQPTGVSLDFTGTRLLVSEFGDDTLSVIDLAAPERRGQTIRVGKGPASFGQFVAQ
jgi:uncharacterized repeat protein (TIGR01451 family)